MKGVDQAYRVHTFKIRVYAPAILPMLAVYVSLAMEAIGDITASAEVSKLEVDGEEFDTRIQGGILVRGHLLFDFFRL